MKRLLIMGFLWWASVCCGQEAGVFIDNESNVREGPGTSFPVVFQSVTGVGFDVLEKKGKWYRIQTSDGKKGWTNIINISLRPGKTQTPAPLVKNAAPDAIPAVPAGPETPEITRWKALLFESPNDPVGNFMLGMAYRDAGQLERARQQVKRLKTLSPVLADDLGAFLTGPAARKNP